MFVVDKNNRKKIISLAQNGYSVKSICTIMQSKTNGIKVTPAEVIAISKSVGITKFGNRDVKEALYGMSMSESLNCIKSDKGMVNKVKNSLILILICIILISVLLSVFVSVKCGVITFCAFIAVFVLLFLVGLFKMKKEKKKK